MESLLAPNIPPVSTSENALPCHSAGSAFVSRVVPATAATIARRVPVIRLNSVDLPTLGRPTSTTVGTDPDRLGGMSECAVRAKLDSVSDDIYDIYTSRGDSKHDQGRHRERGVAHCRHHQGQGRGRCRRCLRSDENLHAARRADRAARIRGVPGEAAQARDRPQPPDGQGSADSARTHDPLQTRQRPPEHRRLTVYPPPSPPFRRFQHRWWLHILLFLLTVATTTIVGITHYLSFISDFGTHGAIVRHTLAFDKGRVLVEAIAYTAAILGILGAHEMGHYLACRYYDVDATLPFFLPFPSLSGTMGAVIKIKEAFPTRTVLFDIAVAGPIGGFIVLVPLLFWGMALSNVLHVPAGMQGWMLGEPLLFKLATWLRFGSVPDRSSVHIHPIVFAAWFGMLATAWNLLPFGQLDGGHLTYATLGDASRYFSLATVAGCVVMCFVSYSWIVMTLMMVVMLFTLGPRHPRVM